MLVQRRANQPGWPRKAVIRKTLSQVGGDLGLPGWPGCHVITKLTFIVFNRRAEIPANLHEPSPCNQALNPPCLKKTRAVIAATLS